jgi:hypothetical protein
MMSFASTSTRKGECQLCFPGQGTKDPDSQMQPTSTTRILITVYWSRFTDYRDERAKE